MIHVEFPRGVKPRLGCLSGELTALQCSNGASIWLPLGLGMGATWKMRDRLYLHIVWTTRDRSPLIDASVATFLERFLSAIAQQERSTIVEMNMVTTHVHLLVRVHPTTSIPRLLQRLKGGSAVIGTREGYAGSRALRWARGYNVESVSPRAMARVRAYIRDQQAHHPREVIHGCPVAGQPSEPVA